MVAVQYGNAKARANAWSLPDADPRASRADLHATPGARRQIPDAAECHAVSGAERRLRRAEGGGRQGHRQEFPLILTSGRLVEYEGGGEETRSNKWLAELQQDMFIEINPADAVERGIKNRDWVMSGVRRCQAKRRAA